MACNYGHNPAIIGTSMVIGGHKNKKEKPVEDEKYLQSISHKPNQNYNYHNLFKVYKIPLGDMLPFQL